MRSENKGLLYYLLIAFGGAWVLWEIPMRAGLSPRSPFFQLAALPGAFAPAIAALVVRRWITREGFADAGLRPNLRSAWRHYLLAWLLPFPVVGAIVLLAAGLGLELPDLTLERFAAWVFAGATAPEPPPPYIWPVILLQLPISALIATPVLWGEEFGWRGYLQPRLSRRRPLLGAVLTGLIWGVWHVPVNLRGYNYPQHPLLGLLLFPVGTVLLSILFGWLQARTRSVWAPSLAHAATNAIGGSLSLLLYAGAPNWIYVSYLGILGWLPLGALCAWVVLTGRLRANRETPAAS